MPERPPLDCGARGGRSSVGRAPGCGPGGRGFKSRRSPSRSAVNRQVFPIRSCTSRLIFDGAGSTQARLLSGTRLNRRPHALSGMASFAAFAWPRSTGCRPSPTRFGPLQSIGRSLPMGFADGFRSFVIWVLTASRISDRPAHGSDRALRDAPGDIGARPHGDINEGGWYAHVVASLHALVQWSFVRRALTSRSASLRIGRGRDACTRPSRPCRQRCRPGDAGRCDGRQRGS